MKTEKAEKKYRIEWIWNGQWKMDNEPNDQTRQLTKEQADKNMRALRTGGYIPQICRTVLEGK